MSEGGGARRVGIDLGGTSIKAGAASAEGALLERREVSADVQLGAQHVVANIARLARELSYEGAIGLGVPGLLDRQAGTVISSPNLPCMDGFPLCEKLAARLELPREAVRFENDANIAALGEHWAGAGRGHHDLALVTLGTGVGGGLILGDELYVGPHGMAGEIGHLVIEPEGRLCGCGRVGCVETTASATAVRRRARERGLTDDLEELCCRARSGGEAEALLLREVGRDLGHALALCVTLLDLRSFLIGGGFGAALDLLRAGILEGITDRCFGREAADFHVLPAELGSDAGWMGAARLADRWLAR